MSRIATSHFTAAVTPVVAGLAVALHVHEQYSRIGELSLSGLLWGLMPYLLCLAVWAKGTLYAPSLVGVSVALAVVLWSYYAAYTGRDGQSGLVLVFMPLWSTFVFCPIAMYLAWIFTRNKGNEVNDRAP
jgi:hypothetical protein